MATNATTTIKIPALNNDEGEAMLSLETYRGFRLGLTSVARFQRVNEHGMSSYMPFSDFKKLMLKTDSRATQKAIDSQHAAVFTPDVMKELAREAIEFYSKK